MSGATLRFSAGALAVIGALLSLSDSQAAEQRVRFQPTPMQQSIAGTWRLASIYQEDDSGRQIDQFGGTPNGFFMADRQGNFSFQIMSNRGRRLFASSPPAVVMARFDGLLEAKTYYGAYHVDDGQQKLTLHVVQCLFRGCDRNAREADLTINGDTLEMTSAVAPSPTGAFYSHTVWKRVCCK